LASNAVVPLFDKTLQGMVWKEGDVMSMRNDEHEI